jgi:hypothetical protein
MEIWHEVNSFYGWNGLLRTVDRVVENVTSGLINVVIYEGHLTFDKRPMTGGIQKEVYAVPMQIRHKIIMFVADVIRVN